MRWTVNKTQMKKIYTCEVIWFPTTGQTQCQHSEKCDIKHESQRAQKKHPVTSDGNSIGMYLSTVLKNNVDVL